MIDLDVAEELVVLFLAGGQLVSGERDAGVGGRDLDAVAIEVVVLRQLPLQAHRVAVDGLRLNAERFLDRQQAVRAGVLRGRVRGETGEK